ncbi:hypothetical protein [Hydrogenophaga pseudoflava]|uniref:hypothetical protein n=1 Tax=Hydrogenophaga pseudoflava TaxID=47421 RepID=UPI00082433C0|nr:hypothetical protein [Hydrogenophaga pseudoflava]
MMLTRPLPDFPDVFPDHRDAHRLYVLPDRVALALDADGLPRFTLLRRTADDGAAQDGGLLQAFLALDHTHLDALAREPSLAGHALEPAPVAQAEARLVLRGVSGDLVQASGQWQPVAVGSADALSLTHHLGPDDTRIVTALVREAEAGGPEPVELELRLRVPGLRPGLPWVVTTTGTTLHDQLQALLPADAPASARDLDRAFLSLPAGLLRWQPLLDDAVPADTEALALQAARSARQSLFRRVGEGFEWHPGVPLTDAVDGLSWRLDLPLPDTVERRLGWSVSEAHRQWAGHALAFPVVTPFRPMQRVTVHVLCALPLHPRGLAQLDVELRYRGPSGAWVHHTFRFDARTGLHALSVVGPAFGAGLELSHRTLAVVAREGQLPLTLSSPDFVPVQGLQLVIGEAEAGVRPVPVAADPSLWAHAVAVRLVVTPASGPTRSIELNPQTPDAWVCLTGDERLTPVTAQAMARAGDGAEQLFWSGPLPTEGLRLNGWALEPTAPETVDLRLAEPLAGATALVAVELLASDTVPADGASGTLLTLEAGQARRWSYWRRSLLQPRSYAWRLHWVGRDPATGATRPLRVGPWRVDQTPELLVEQVPT